MQEELIHNAKTVQPKALDVVERLDCGHEPHLAKTEELVHIIARAAKAESW